MEMKKIFVLAITMVLIAISASAQTPKYQKGYTRKNGTYVTGHYKTTSDRTNHNNYSTKGNVNPTTGKKGSRAKDYSPSASNYGRGKTIKTGPRGGQYYSRSNNKRTYVPKRVK